MSYRIIETTDRHYLGTSIEVPPQGMVLMLGGCEVVAQTVTVVGDTLTISNPNYIIIAVKE